ncbi:phosphoribosylglycinamide formyltransferase [Cyclobacterium sediminis]
MKNIAILASGSGSNAEKIINHFQGSTKARISLIASNKKAAYVLERAKKHGVPTHTFTKAELESGKLTEILINQHIDFVVLAGFLLQIPKGLIKAFPNQIVNIHPALLPKYGGKGMYGDNVHKAVKAAEEKETGITIHLVNENYDEGKIIFQTAVKIDKIDTPDQIAEKVHVLEHKYYPKIIESLI